MSISETTILEFQKAVAEEYGREVSVKEAREILGSLVTYFDLLAKIEYRRIMALENSELIPKRN